jgi:formate dehydrogenase subunit gamma
MNTQEARPGAAVHRGDPVTVDRYTAGARVNHWVTATCLVLLALSGLALFHPSLFFLSHLFGGGQATRAIHPWIGVVLFFSFAGLFIRFWRLNLWRGADTTWMVRLNEVLGNRDNEDPELVEIGKYNAGQKVVFWGMSVLIVVLISSGLVIWDQYFSDYTSLEQKRIAVLIHSLAAIVIICVWIVHVYAAIWVRGTIGAMTRGRVTGGWAWRHHRKWLRDLVTGKPAEPAE